MAHPLALPAPDGGDAALELSRMDGAAAGDLVGRPQPAKPRRPAGLDPHLGLTAMAPNDRHQIVILMPWG